MTTRTLLVGCGRLGLRVGELLLADQDERGRHEVLGLRRDPSSLPSGFVPVAADLSAALPTPLPRVDAMVITLTPSAAPSYREPLAHLAAALPEIPRRTVFVSSHLMSEMALTAEHLIVVGRGRLVADISVADLVARSTTSVRVDSPCWWRPASEPS